MCYANGASAQLPSASPPTPIKSKTLRDSPVPAKVCPTPSLHSKVDTSGPEHSFASYPAPQYTTSDRGNRRGGDTERQVVCSCSSGAAHWSERRCKLHGYNYSAVEKKQGSMEPVVTGRPLVEWNQTNVSAVRWFAWGLHPSLLWDGTSRYATNLTIICVRMTIIKLQFSCLSCHLVSLMLQYA